MLAEGFDHFAAPHNETPPFPFLLSHLRLVQPAALIRAALPTSPSTSQPASAEERLKELSSHLEGTASLPSTLTPFLSLFSDFNAHDPYAVRHDAALQAWLGGAAAAHRDGGGRRASAAGDGVSPAGATTAAAAAAAGAAAAALFPDESTDPCAPAPLYLLSYANEGVDPPDLEPEERKEAEEEEEEGGRGAALAAAMAAMESRGSLAGEGAAERGGGEEDRSSAEEEALRRALVGLHGRVEAEGCCHSILVRAWAYACVRVFVAIMLVVEQCAHP